MPEKKIEMRFRKKMLRNAQISTVIILFIALISYYFMFHALLKSRFEDRLISLASTAAILINADQHNNLKIRTDESSKDYQEIKDLLQAIQKNNPNIKNIYTMRKTNQKDKWEFVVDTGSGKESSHIGDLYDVSNFEQMKKSYDRPITNNNFTFSQAGTFMSGYAPIKDNSGKTVGIVGIKFESSDFITRELKILFIAILIFFTVSAISTFYAKKIITRSWQPVYELIDGIDRIQKGELGFRFDIKTNDEFEIIGNSLNKSANTFFDYQRLLEQDIKLMKSDREKIFKVYRDVIYSVTQGKFNLIDNEEKFKIDKEISGGQKIKLAHNEDVNRARELVENYLKEINYPEIKIMYILLCVSEAATNALKHAGGGLMRFNCIEDKIIIIIADQGKGMEFDQLPNMLFLNGFSTQISMGYGYSLIYKYCDRIFLNTSSYGTFLAMEFAVIKITEVT